MEKQTEIISLEAIKNQFEPIKNTYLEHRRSLNLSDRLALFVTRRVGTMGFFAIIFLWTIFWLSWNVLASEDLRFDPYPAFVLWLFISNLIQIHLMPLIMVGQNLQGKYAELRSEQDYKTNVKAEKEIELILGHLERQEKAILEILEKINKQEKIKVA